MNNKLSSMGLLFCVSTIVLHADPDSGARINHYGPASEIFVYSLDSFVKHRDVQGMEKMLEQMLTLRKPDGSIRLDGRSSDHIRYVHKRYRAENNEEAVRFMAPFLFVSGTSFIENLGRSRESYEWATKKDKEPSASYIEMRRCQMVESQWDIDVALKGRKIITQDIMRVKRNYLKESFLYLQEDIQAKILEEAEASFCSDCKAKSDYFSNPPCEDFYEKLIIMREAHKEFKEKKAAEHDVVAVDAVQTEPGSTSESAGVNSESTPQNNG